MNGPATPIAPAHVCVQFAHAVIEHLAGQCAADVLHIKGAALVPDPSRPRRIGSDADVLVRPGHVARLLSAMTDVGWRVETDFEHGSPFGHATTLVHREWGYADVHRHFPGITAPPEEAFDLLWSTRGTRAIAGIDCGVPNPTAHAVILVLNAARPGVNSLRDIQAVWVDADADRRAEMHALAGQLGAEVAFAAATGDLERFRGHREYDLWRITTEGGSRTEEWIARMKAAPTRREALRLALAAPLVNTDHLAVMLGRPPTRGEVVREFVSRIRRGVAETVHTVSVRVRERRRP